ncbi:hypothetical protein NIES4103_70250 (plasmid) [Nostoc sp. NIES-4103]|nr:hypothetical protein NIES4103_27370 [Nostoc sp. NIES-4103]BAZ54340.1 hypothetical protein NIES4103_70250 [Nostoc sp. NIES-4103]
MNTNECIRYRALELAQAAKHLAANVQQYPEEQDYLKNSFEALTIQYEHLKKLFGNN